MNTENNVAFLTAVGQEALNRSIAKQSVPAGWAATNYVSLATTLAKSKTKYHQDKSKNPGLVSAVRLDQRKKRAFDKVAGAVAEVFGDRALTDNFITMHNMNHQITDAKSTEEVRNTYLCCL